MYEGKLDEAIAHYKKTVELFPDARTPRNNLAGTYALKGMYSEAFEQSLIRWKLGGQPPEDNKARQLAFERDGYNKWMQKQ